MKHPNVNHFKTLMASAFSSQQATHALFILLPLNFPLSLIPNSSVAKHNNTCDYFKKGENVKKGMSQDDLLALLQDTGSCKGNDNVLHKEKFSYVLSSYSSKRYILGYIYTCGAHAAP